jgi:hypothetical protein
VPSHSPAQAGPRRGPLTQTEAAGAGRVLQGGVKRRPLFVAVRRVAAAVACAPLRWLLSLIDASHIQAEWRVCRTACCCTSARLAARRPPGRRAPAARRARADMHPCILLIASASLLHRWAPHCSDGRPWPGDDLRGRSGSCHRYRGELRQRACLEKIDGGHEGADICAKCAHIGDRAVAKVCEYPLGIL